MKHYSIKLALLSILTFVAVQALSQSQYPAPSQSQPSQSQPQAQQPTEAPPHVDAEPNPDDRSLENSIKDELKKDPHMAYSRVAVHVTDTEIMLTGVVLSSTAKEQAAKIAGEHAGNRKIKNQLKVNPNINPPSGL
jgi:osmotically-inducible protein OsmY